MHAHFFHFCRHVDLSTCLPVNMSTCQPVTCDMTIYGVCILLRGRGSCPQAFRCESLPTPLNLTYILPYDCPCFARMRNSFTSVDLSTCLPVDLSTVDLSTCLTVNMSTCHPVDLSPVIWLYMEFAFCCGGLGGLPLRHFVVNQCLLH